MAKSIFEFINAKLEGGKNPCDFCPAYERLTEKCVFPEKYRANQTKSDTEPCIAFNNFLMAFYGVN